MKTIPHSTGVEQSLLGALIFDNREIDLVSGILSEASFYAEQHIIIWRALLKLRADSKIADPNTLLEFFERENQLKKIGGEEYLASLVSNAALEAEIPDYAALLKDLQNRRDLISVAQQMEASSIKPEVGQSAGDIAVQASETLAAVMIGSTVNEPVEARVAAKEYIRKVRKGQELETRPFLKTASETMNRRFGGGFFPSDLIILAGRPSMGKTMKALSIIQGVARQPSLKEPDKRARVAFFSLEMDYENVIGRMMTANSHEFFGKRYSSQKMRSYEIKKEHLDSMESHLDKMGDNIHIDDDGSVTIRDIEIRSLNLIRKYGYLDMIVVDYLQIINATKEDAKHGKQISITNISAGLKRIAKKLDVPVIALCQLSRSVEQREDKRPMLSDLRDSGSIEQDADVVIFCYREHYYLERSEPMGSLKADKHIQWTVDCQKTLHQFTAITAKQRLGKIGTDTIWCDTTTGYVGDQDPSDSYGTSEQRFAWDND